MNYLQKELDSLTKSDNSILDFIQGTSLDGLWYLDLENPDNEWMNSRYWLTLGYDPNEMPHKTSAWQGLIHPDDLKSATDSFNKHRENSNHPFDEVLRYTHKNGSTVWIRCRGLAIRDNEGKAIRMLGTHINITKEKETEEKYGILFNSIDEGFCIIEMIFDEENKPVDYRFLVINTSFERQTGLHNAVGKRMREFAPNHEEHWFETYGEIALTGKAIRFENRAEQLHRWYDVHAFRFGEALNRQVAVLFNDITQRKQAEEQLMTVNNELDAFAYSVSHDLRTPLRSIIGYSKILGEDYIEKLDDKGQQVLGVIQQNARRMNNLIDNLLEFSKLGQRELEKSDIDTDKLVQNVLSRVYHADQFHAEILTKPLAPARADRELLTQVWVNLISNALKYSAKREKPKIEIGSRSAAGEVVYYVADNGSGFDMKYADKLFGVFQRLHKPQEFEGTGVGLSIVKRIITKHGGRVWAEAEVDKGATFYFSLPIQ